MFRERVKGAPVVNSEQSVCKGAKANISGISLCHPPVSSRARGRKDIVRATSLYSLLIITPLSYDVPFAFLIPERATRELPYT